MAAGRLIGSGEFIDPAVELPHLAERVRRGERSW